MPYCYSSQDGSCKKSPIFSHKNKDLDGLIELRVSMTGMYAHGHGDYCYAHYGLDIFSHYSNFIVGSFAKLLQDLELPPKSTSRELFVESRSPPLFDAILNSAEICKALLALSPELPVAAKRLPPIFNVQMDKTTGDIKNICVFWFWSLLVAKKI